jgi:anti-sigma factor RsiW
MNPMQCDRARDLIGAYVDGELSGAQRQAIAGHLQSCKACAADAQAIRRMGRQIAVAGPETAPASLTFRIRADLAAAEIADGGERTVWRRASAWWNRYGRQAGALGAACAASVLLTVMAVSWWSSNVRLEREIVSAHIRSLLQDSPIQIASSDVHTVKPWFTGRVEFAPQVKDLTPEGFPLLGGRLDYVGERRVGVIVYQRRRHLVNVFIWPAENTAPIAPYGLVQKGYNLVTWSEAGVTYWAISDLNAGELLQFQSLL